MTGTIIEADVEEVVLGWLEGLGWSVTIRPKLISGELRERNRYEDSYDKPD